MEFLVDLWQPILLSAVLVFIVSSIVHMATPMHKSDWKKLPQEEDVLSSIRSAGVPPGEYMFPFPKSMADCASPEMVEKFTRGPVGNMTLLQPGPVNMGKALLQWFLFSVVVSVFAGYVGSFALAEGGRGSEYMVVFRLTGTVAFVGYSLALATNSIWKGTAWSTTLKFCVDGLLYALVTAGTFAWLWPAA